MEGQRKVNGRSADSYIDIGTTFFSDQPLTLSIDQFH